MSNPSVGVAAILVGLTVGLAVWGAFAPISSLPTDATVDDILGVQAVSTGGIFNKYLRPALRNFMPQTPMAVQLKARHNGKIVELLVRSGNPWGLQPEEYYALRFVTGLIGLIAATGLSLLTILPVPVPAAMFGGALMGFVLPRVMLDSARGNRKKAATRGLPEALDLLVITMNAGVVFHAALVEVTARLPEGVIRTELSRAVEDLRAGRSTIQALTDLARRTASAEVESFAKAVVMAERLGSDTTNTLRQQADAARAEYEQVLAEKTAKLGTTLMFPLMGFLLPALFLTVLGPAFQQLITAFG
ncbi:MAG: type II secretion system F family protein [Propionicimonas sp.]